jgi:hypothetical protein
MNFISLKDLNVCRMKFLNQVFLVLSIFFVLYPIAVKCQTPNEILGRPTNNSIVISVLFSQQSEVYYEFGTTKGIFSGSTQPVIAVANEPTEIKISGLNPDSRYYYRTRYKFSGETNFRSGSEHSFMTQRAEGKTFRFTVEADPHPYDKKCHPPLWNLALTNQLANNPDFMLDLGDTFGDDHEPFTITNEEVKQLHLNDRTFFGLACHSVPLFFCLGNHEGESGYYLLQTPPNNLAVYGTNWRKFYYPNPNPDGFYSGNNTSEEFGMGLPENYYAWEWGDALFVVLDVYRYYTANAKPKGWDWTIGKQQYDWFKSILKNSNAKYKFVFAHHVLGETRGGIIPAGLFEWGGFEQNGTTWGFDKNRPGWEKPLHQLMVDNHVSIFFQGHDHLYAREELDGIIYQTVPMPSDSSYTLGMIANADAFSGLKLPGSGHLLISVSPDSVKVDFVQALLPKDETPEKKNGTIIYSYSVKSGGTINLENDVRKNFPSGLTISPNPFRDKVKIRFALNMGGKVSLSVFDISGRQIDKIDAGFLPAGFNSLEWKSTNRDGYPLKPGIYTFRIESIEECLTEKIILQK